MSARHPYTFDRIWRAAEGVYDNQIVDTRSGRVIYDSRDYAAANAEWERLVAEWEKQQEGHHDRTDRS